MAEFFCGQLVKAGLVAGAMVVAPHLARATDSDSLVLPTGQHVTPTAPTGAVRQFLNPDLPAYPNFVAGEAVRSQLSPDGTTLAIICAGHNSLDDSTGNVDVANSTQYIFLYDVGGANKTKPALVQVIKQMNSHVGLAWSPDGKGLYAAGGNDDAVYVYAKAGSTWAQAATIPLGHSATHTNAGLGVEPNASGLGISADGATLVVANNYNDSVSVIDTASRTVRYEHDLRPYFANNEGMSGLAGGTYPFAVAVKGGDTAYVSANGDREIVIVDVSSPTAGHLIKRIKLAGNALGLALDATQTTLYVAQDNADEVAVINTATNTIVDTIDTRAPIEMLDLAQQDENDRQAETKHPHYTGAAPTAVTISPDGSTLYAINNGANSIAVIPLTGGPPTRS
jgi:DNA-binding beta-propeller fold protein YncE